MYGNNKCVWISYGMCIRGVCTSYSNRNILSSSIKQLKGELMSKDIKLEKVTLWTAIPLYGAKDTTTSALDYIMDGYNGAIDSECSILAYDAEDYEMIPKRIEGDNSGE